LPFESDSQADAQGRDPAQGDPALPCHHRLPQDQGIAEPHPPGLQATIFQCLWLSGIRTLKTESDMHCDYKSRDDARLSLFDYIEAFYNRQRRPSSIGYEAALPYKTMKSPGRVSPFVGKIGSGHRANSSKAVVGSGERGRTAFGARR